MNILIVGAGPVGCTLANLFSKNKDNKIHIIEKRNHIAGNCFDFYDNNNVLIHKYGPHYFRTNKKYIIEYLSQFTKWIDGNYYVKCYDGGKFYQFPINLNTLEEVFEKKFNVKLAKIFFESQQKEIISPKGFEEYLINRIGRKLYEKFYKNYTIKQWGIHPKKLKSYIAKRIPVRINRNDKYLKEKYQIMPKQGFTQMFKKMINHKNIKISLNSRLLVNSDTITMLRNKYDLILYTGPIDIFFKNKFGKLSWRSLKFKYKNFKTKFKQSVCQINYPNQFKFTRTVEYKHVTKQKNNSTTISYEYPIADGDPYYPVNTEKDELKYEKYLEVTKNYEMNNIFFVGRLAQYTYINTDEAIDMALKLYKKLNRKFKFNK